MLDKIDDFFDLINITEALCEVRQYETYKAAYAPSLYIDKVDGNIQDFIRLHIKKDDSYELQKIGSYGDYVTILVTDDVDMIIDRMRVELYGKR